MKQRRFNNILALLVMIGFCFSSSYAGASRAAQKAAKPKTKAVKPQTVQVTELRNADQVKEAFQRDKGKVRLVTILSPT